MEMCKTLLGFAHFHRLGGYELKTTKTGQITCYKNRTFSFATDSAIPYIRDKRKMPGLRNRSGPRVAPTRSVEVLKAREHRIRIGGTFQLL